MKEWLRSTSSANRVTKESADSVVDPEPLDVAADRGDQEICGVGVQDEAQEAVDLARRLGS
jgi:hypothetical protein